jgi:hypothetical protein
VRPERRVVHLEVIAGPPTGERAPMISPARAARTASGPSWMLATRDAWLCLAERTLGDWASTLRAAFLMLIALAGMIVLIGVVFGFGGVLLGALLGSLVLLLRG